MFKPITKVLKKGLNATRIDQKIFNDYSKGVISLNDCMSMFFKNNRVSKTEQEAITQDLFKAWLYTEGYGCRNGI